MKNFNFTPDLDQIQRHMEEMETDFYLPIDPDEDQKDLEKIANESGSNILTYWFEFINKGKLPSYEWIANQVFKPAEYDDHGRRNGRYFYERFIAPCKAFNFFQFYSNEFIEHIVETIKKLNACKIVEIGAGDGFLSFFLKKRGIDIVATDNFIRPYIDRRPHVEKLDHKSALEKYNPDLVVINWEELDGTYSIDVLEYPPVKCLLWIGEELGGCTGSAELWEFDYDNTRNSYCLSRSDTWHFDNEFSNNTYVMKFYPSKTDKKASTFSQPFHGKW